MDIRHQGVHLLQNGTLHVEVMDPNDPARYNTGVRFSPVANVLRVAMNGKDFLFSPVQHDPATENGGLANEFDIGHHTEPPGFGDASMGGSFLKIGVGALCKSLSRYGATSYDFFQSYKPARLAETRATWSADAAHFDQESPLVDGYAYRLAADVVLAGNAVAITYRLTNTGRKPFTTEQYAHDYMIFDNAAVGPGYSVSFPYDFTVAQMQPEQEKHGHAIVFARPFTPKVQAVNLLVSPPPGYGRPNEITVTNAANGLSVRATVSLPSNRVAVHATPRYLCPEQFVQISLAPGQAQEWTRRYEFSETAPAGAKVFSAAP